MAERRPAASYPTPANAAVTAVMKGNRRRDTLPERHLRSELHRRGLRYRVDFLLRAGIVKVRPDIVFTRRRIAVFVDGCYWHACPEHGTSPARNKGYWLPKLQRNVDRDRRVDDALRNAGWVVLRVWEHENVEAAADGIQAAVQGSTTSPARTSIM